MELAGWIFRRLRASSAFMVFGCEERDEFSCRDSEIIKSLVRDPLVLSTRPLGLIRTRLRQNNLRVEIQYKHRKLSTSRHE